MRKKIAIFLILITWPISLLLNNTFKDFLSYIFPFINPKFAIFPLLFVVIYFKFKKPLFTGQGVKALLILISLIIFVLFLKPFYGQTIFISNNDAKQEIIQKANLYNSIFLARIFQNKARIPLNKLTNNFFALTDPNNYFFGFAPRQITVDNQNLKKFPFLSLPFLLIGLFYLTKLRDWKLITAFLVVALINLSLLTNFDRNDFILWPFLSLIIIHGLNIFDTKFKSTKYYGVATSFAYEFIFIVFAAIEILRIFIK